MAGQSITGGWARRNVVKVPAALVPPIDPEHMHPTDNPQYVGMNPVWQENTAAPALPDEVLGQQAWQEAPVAPGIGPVDHTPEDHAYGMGTGHALTTLEAQDLRMEWHNDDQGAVAAQAWVPEKDRDGTPIRVDLVDQLADGDSPATLQLGRTGIGQPNDPEATARQPSRRERRWWDRYIDMHRYDAIPTPVQPQYARPTPGREAVPNGNQLVPPYGNNVAFPPSQSLTPDKFIVQTVRRIPGDWVDMQATDGTEQVLQAGTQYGLTTW